MVAADSRHYGYDPTDLLQSLLHSGADLTKKDKQGWSAIDHAMSDANRNDSSSIAVKLLVSQSPLGQQLLDLLQQHSFDRFTEAVLRQGIHDVQALVDVLSDPRLDNDYFRQELGGMRMGQVVTLLRHAKELLSFVPGGAGSKRARDEFETHAESRCCLFMTPTT